MSSKQNIAEDSTDTVSRSSSDKEGITNKVPAVVLRDAELVTTKGNVVTKDGVVISTRESDASLSTNIFRDPEVRAHYIAVYEKAQYECRHVFDGDLEWSQEEEKKLVRKLDWHGKF